MTDADMVANGIEGAPSAPQSENDGFVPLPDDQLDEAIEKCADDADAAYFNSVDDGFSGPWQDDLNQVYTKTVEDPRAKEVFTDLRECYDSEGMTFDEDIPGLVTAADESRIDEEQVGLALKVAKCQQSTDSTQRLADIMAGYQAPIIEEYASEFVEIQNQQDEALTKAEEYIAAHPELFEAP
ncbi:MAG: hypothetical protein ACTH1Z_10370 [Ancrocorticia sp.]